MKQIVFFLILVLFSCKGQEVDKIEILKSPTIPVHYHNTAKRKVNLTIDKIKELIDYYNKAK